MPAQGPVGWLQGVMLGERHSTYRRFVLALAVVAVGLAAAYGLTAVGLVAVDAGVVDFLGATAALAVTVFLLLGLLQTLVLASTYERGASEVAETVEDGKETASEAKGTAEAAREAADEAKETVEQERERLPSEERPDEEA